MKEPQLFGPVMIDIISPSSFFQSYMKENKIRMEPITQDYDI